MNNKPNSDKNLASLVSKLINIIIVLIVIVIVLVGLLLIYIPIPSKQNKVEGPKPDAFGNFTDAAKQEALKIKDTTNYWIAPEVSTIGNQQQKETILYGRDLIANTAEYFGPNGKIFKSSTNGMNCQNCHLDAGTKIYGNNYSAVASTYPKYRARSGGMETVYKRINDCFERSLNGKAIDTNSREMQAIVTYIKWLGTGIKKGIKPPGSGLKEIPFLERAADKVKGELVYTQKCQSCHQQNGEGKFSTENTAYTYPPLWGNNSYNVGAGLYRLSNFAKFVKYNMPLGVTHNNTQLTDEEAWDVAAFVNSQPHPSKDLKKDWPKISEKPFDNPFGPYADGFSEEQHKYGPFKVIKDKLKNN